MANTVKTSKPPVAGKINSPLKRTAGKKIVARRTSLKTASRLFSKRNVDDPVTKKILIQAASIGFAKAAAKTMKVMGYNIIVQDGWVVKKFRNGTIKRISKLQTNDNPIILD